VPESLASTSIEAQLQRRRAAVADEWRQEDVIVLVGAGDPIHIPGRHDLTYPFRAHSEYYYLTDRNRPGGVLAFDPQAGWSDFVVPVTDDERVWSGVSDGDPGGRPLPELPAWLQSRAGRPAASLGAPVRGVESDSVRSADLRLALSSVRRPKDAVELERMRVAERATRAAFAAVVPVLQPGVTEREAQIAFESAALGHGGDAIAYDTIIGGGTNSAVLHFAPTSRPFGAGELVLIDAGAEYRCYASDVTRTLPVGGELSSEQRELHSVVRAAELAAIQRCTVGTEWRDVHLTAAHIIAAGLVAFGVLRGEPSALVDSGAVWLFFPHGVGHLVGLGVRDAGDPIPERRDEPPPFPGLRINLPLAPGFVVTVEPGLYFIPALLQDPERRRRYRDQVIWDRLDRLLGFGGIRIEDNVLITDAGPAVLTEDIPLLGGESHPGGGR
jgi:Xaa-Pro aminopeptidase